MDFLANWVISVTCLRAKLWPSRGIPVWNLSLFEIIQDGPAVFSYIFLLIF
jgi:hypothetical protein